MINKENPMEMLELFTQMMGGTDSISQFFGGLTNKPKVVNPYESLKNGFELRPIEVLAEGGQFVLDNKNKYSHLYKDGIKVSDEIFRKGGLCHGFKDGYCSLIHYVLEREHDLGSPLVTT